jgi:cysteinyl-tRNA synthetase
MLKIYNTLSRSVGEFKPINPPQVGIYSCGPTVYDYQHIGHMRRYVGDDILVRVLKFNGFGVKHVMNITDVGHLVSDADEGEDKMEKGAKKFGKSVWDIAKIFENQFKESCSELNINLPKDLMHATDYIEDQIILIKTLEKKGFTYQTSDGVYFNTSKFPDYFKLSRQNPDELKAGIRIEMGEKKYISDFALWKFSPEGEKRQMEWDSPWGIGFPGWHIECSAMSMKALGESFDIHTGGIDHINIHHTNEIAQSESATGKPFAKYWIHHNFLIVDGQKMSKSMGNFYTVQDVVKNGLNPLVLRYLYLQTHYRQEMNFTWASLEAAQNAFEKIKGHIRSWEKSGEVIREYEKKFTEAINNDLNMPEAIAVMWEMLKSDNSDGNKLKTLLKLDEVLGFGFNKFKNENLIIPEAVGKLLDKREEYRKLGDFEMADKIRSEIEELGYILEDSENATGIKKK